MSKLKPGWCKAKLRDIALVNPRSREGRAPQNPVTFVRMPNISETSWRFIASEVRPWAEVSKGFTSFSEGDVLFAKITPCMENGKGAVAVGLKNGLGAGTTELHVIRPLAGIDPFYLYHYLHQDSYRRRAAGSMTGAVGQARVPAGFIEETEIPLAPLAEQKRIVARLSEALEKVEASKTRLERVPDILRRFRQSILAAACSGRLTEDWRLKQCGNSKASKKVADIPESWERVKFEDLCEDITVGHVGPTAKEYVPSGIPFLRSMNVRRFRFDPTGLKFVSREFHRKLSKCRLGPGDLAIVRSGNAGMACVIPPSLKEANCADLIVVRPGPRLNAHYACIFVNSTEMRSHIDQVKVGIAQAHFNIGEMRKSILALPPIREQEEIVHRVEKMFGLADQVEARHGSATVSIEQLKQAVLAKSFAGELVPQDPKDEPATALLEKSMAERGVGNNGGKGRVIAKV